MNMIITFYIISLEATPRNYFGTLFSRPCSYWVYCPKFIYENFNSMGRETLLWSHEETTCIGLSTRYIILPIISYSFISDQVLKLTEELSVLSICTCNRIKLILNNIKNMARLWFMWIYFKSIINLLLTLVLVF